MHKRVAFGMKKWKTALLSRALLVPIRLLSSLAHSSLRFSNMAVVNISIITHARPPHRVSWTARRPPRSKCAAKATV